MSASLWIRPPRTGTWADKAQPGGFHFDARGARHEKPQWVHLGPVDPQYANKPRHPRVVKQIRTGSC